MYGKDAYRVHVYIYAVRSRYLNNFPHLSMLSLTLRKAMYPTVSFLLMLFIIFVGCGQAFNMASVHT